MSESDEKSSKGLKTVIKQLEVLNDECLMLVQKERPYKIPKGYVYWKKVCGLIASVLRYSRKYSGDFSRLDSLTSVSAYLTLMWFVQDAPIYCLSTKLLRAFEQTDIEEKPELLLDLKPPLPTFMLLFPQGAVYSPSGKALEYIIVHLSDSEYPERSSGSAYGFELPGLQHLQHKYILNWSGMDSGYTAWVSDNSFDETGNVIATQMKDIEEDIFVKKIRSIVLQCLLTLTYAPELLTQDQAEGSLQPAKGLHKRQQKQAITRTPRWLGKNYTPPSPVMGGGGGNHASRRSHWRRGHWRRIVVGARQDQQRKWAWIQPVRVNA